MRKSVKYEEKGEKNCHAGKIGSTAAKHFNSYEFFNLSLSFSCSVSEMVVVSM